jgi:hypothetical protein
MTIPPICQRAVAGSVTVPAAYRSARTAVRIQGGPGPFDVKM